MPAIDPALIPTIPPGQIFERFTEDSTLNVRWIEAGDPVFFEAVNRPMADITLRQLIIAKALDSINLKFGHLSLFPFLITCKVVVGSTEIEIPTSWIWDMHVSLPAKWEFIRLARIKRISGHNEDTSGTITGKLRLVFSAQAVGSLTEVYMFHVDYQIDNFFSYQYLRIVPETTLDDTPAIDPGEATTEDGFIILRTLPMTNATYKDFVQHLAPPDNPVDSNNDGIFDSPAVYEIANTPPGGITNPDDFLASSLSHGTGVVVASAFNAMPATDSDISSFLKATNYPFRVGANRTSIHGITIPAAFFREFDMVMPAADEATGDTSMQNSPVWISSIERMDTLANTLKFTFSTYTITSAVSPQVVEFATLTLLRSYTAGRVVNIIPTVNLLAGGGTSEALYRQMFGAGHVVLSSLWGATTGEITAFFDSFLALVDLPARTTYGKDTTIIQALALSRSSRYIPNKGQYEALAGSTARRATPQIPSDSNRFVNELDEGLGDPVDFRTLPGFPDALRENADIDAVGYKATRIHKAVKLCVDANGTAHNYDTDILPRLRCLLGRDPILFDLWFDGTLLKFYSGDEWITL